MFRTITTILTLMAITTPHKSTPETPPQGGDQGVKSYFQRRMDQLGITEETNRVELWRYEAGKGNVLEPMPVFQEHPKGIEIIPYTLGRQRIRIEKDNSRWKKDWSIVRHEKPIEKENGETIKYLMPKGHGSYPLLPPNILEAYEHKKDITTLFLTEGYFKAWKGYMHGLHIIGLPSITHMKNRDTGKLHEDILKVIDMCRVKRCVWLTDGDCLDITGKEITEKKDLYTRPVNFFSSINTFKQLLEDLPCDKYFFHINTDEIVSQPLFYQLPKPTEKGKSERDLVKGLDDLLCAFPDRIDEIVQDALTVSAPGTWFFKMNINTDITKVKNYFKLNNVTEFYLFHSDRRKDLKGKEFKFHGTLYQYDEEKGECMIKVPAASKLYFRVGDDYYKHIEVPNKHKQIEKTFKGRRKQTIMDDHGKDFCKHIPKYEAFCNVPHNVNFQPVINNCFNVYNPLTYLPEEEICTEEDCPTIISFIKHIFGHKTVKFKHPKTKEHHEFVTWHLALDYLQVAYQQPAEKLPILCLVSRQNNTGKSTMGNLLKLIFGANVAIVGNQDLAGDFNAHWATKLFVICDETKIDKQHVVEKVKSLSTANKVTMNAKGKDHVEIDCFIKFIFITNNEETFISMNDEDIRYWVIKVPPLVEENPTILDNFVEEIPAFLSFLNNRKMLTEKLNRMWFYPTLLRTDALNKVIENSHSMVKKELRHKLKQMFLDFGVQEIRMAAMVIKENFFKNKEENYIERVLKEEFHLHPIKAWYYKDAKFKTEELAIAAVKKDLKLENDFECLQHIKSKGDAVRYTYPKWILRTPEFGKPEERHMVMVKEVGRPYVFKRSDFVSEEEETDVPDDIKSVVDTGEETEAVRSATVKSPDNSLPF
jgi:hypothetical protein